jgi:hypothetical protein
VYTDHVVKIETDDLSIYYETPEGEPLRKLTVEMHVDCWTFKTLGTEKYTVRDDTLVDLLASCREIGIVPGSTRGLKMGRQNWVEGMSEEFCRVYHDHSEPEARLLIKKKWICGGWMASRHMIL